MSAKHIFFFRGLSTFASDNIRWAFLDLGPMHRKLSQNLSQRGIVFHPISGMGAGTLSEVADRAYQFLQTHPVWLDAKQPVSFLGHSAGGLIARLLLSRSDIPKDKVERFLSIATPHNGTSLAETCINMPRDFRGSYLMLMGTGYNISKRRKFFEEFTASHIQHLFAQSPSSPEELPVKRVGSLVCHVAREEWCLPLKLFSKIPAFAARSAPSDGMIETDTQRFGEVIAELPIDHFRQVGIFGEPHRFEKMCDVIQDFFVTA